MKSKSRLSILLLTLITASFVLPSALAQTTDRNRTPNQEALYARYTHDELMFFATSLNDRVNSTYYAYKEAMGVDFVYTERYDISDLTHFLKIDNFTIGDNPNPIQRVAMPIEELIHIHRTKLNAYRQAVCYLIRDMNKLGSVNRTFLRFADEFNQIYYLHSKVLNAIDSLIDRLDLQTTYRTEPEHVLIRETNQSVILKRRPFFVLEGLWSYLPIVVNDLGGRLQSELPGLDEQIEEKCMFMG